MANKISNIHGFWAELDGRQRPELDYSQLWDAFNAMRKESEDWKDKHGVYAGGQYQGVSKSWFNREVEKELFNDQKQ
jgi:hypothetical protein